MSQNRHHHSYRKQLSGHSLGTSDRGRSSGRFESKSSFESPSTVVALSTLRRVQSNPSSVRASGRHCPIVPCLSDTLACHAPITASPFWSSQKGLPDTSSTTNPSIINLPLRYLIHISSVRRRAGVLRHSNIQISLIRRGCCCDTSALTAPRQRCGG